MRGAGLGGARLAILAAGALLAACTSRVDGSQALQYPCSRDAGGTGECRGGWVCGLEGFCHDPSVAAAYQCDSNSDCEQQWHCGVAHVCYDRADAGSVACRANAPEDCAPGWQCGLENVCHDLDAGAPYRCTSDEQCTRGWRCGPDQVCAEAEQDALRPPTPLEALTRDRISPVSIFDPIAFSAGKDLSTVPVTQAFLLPDELVFQLDAQTAPFPRTVHVRLLRPDGGDVAVFGGTAFVADPAGLWRYTWSADGGTVADVPFPAMPAAQLRLTDERPVTGWPLLLAFSGTELAILQVDAGVGSPPMTLPARAGTPPEIADIVSIGTNFQLGGLLAASSDGLFYAPRSDAGGYAFLALDGGVSALPEFRAISVGRFGNVQCGADAGPAITRLVPNPRIGLRSRVLAELEGTDPSEFAQLELAVTDTSQCGTGGLRDRGGGVACPDGGTVVGFAPQSSTEFGTRCRVSPDTEEQFHWLELGDGGLTATLVTPDPLSGATTRPSRTTPTVGGLYDDHGRTVRCVGGVCKSRALFQAPDKFAGASSAGFVISGWEYPGWEDFEFDPSTGFVETFRSDVRCGGFVGAPELAMSCPFDVIGDPVTISDWTVPARPPLMRLAGSEAIYVPVIDFDPFHGQVLTTSTGSRELIATMEDVIFAGDVSNQDGGTLPDGGAYPVSARLTPLQHVPITSLATIDPAPDAGVLLEGYLLAQQRLFAFEAINEVRWDSREIFIPPGEPLAVFADGSRGRVGYSDGQVLSLPTRVLIGNALPVHAQPVQGYASLCGSAYALGQDGIYQLAPGSTVVGDWRPVPLSPAPIARPGANPYLPGRLESTGEELMFFTSEGQAYRITAPSCP